MQRKSAGYVSRAPNAHNCTKHDAEIGRNHNFILIGWFNKVKHLLSRKGSIVKKLLLYCQDWHMNTIRQEGEYPTRERI